MTVRVSSKSETQGRDGEILDDRQGPQQVNNGMAQASPSTPSRAKIRKTEPIKLLEVNGWTLERRARQSEATKH